MFFEPYLKAFNFFEAYLKPFHFIKSSWRLLVTTCLNPWILSWSCLPAFLRVLWVDIQSLFLHITKGVNKHSKAQLTFTPDEGSFYPSSIFDILKCSNYKLSAVALKGAFFAIGHKVGIPNVICFTLPSKGKGVVQVPSLIAHTKCPRLLTVALVQLKRKRIPSYQSIAGYFWGLRTSIL